mgnify:FL=1
MMKVTVCVGSSCHLKGSRQVVEELRQLIADNKLEGKVDLAGTFCMGKCEQGVCVTVDGELFSVNPNTVKTFFNDNILAKA